MVLAAAILGSPREFLLVLLLAVVASEVPSTLESLVIILLAGITPLLTTSRELLFVFGFTVIIATIETNPNFWKRFLLAGALAYLSGIEEVLLIFAISSIAGAFTGTKGLLLLSGVIGIVTGIAGFQEFLLITALTLAVGLGMVIIQGVACAVRFLLRNLSRSVYRLFSSGSSSLFVLLLTISMICLEESWRFLLYFLSAEIR
ncbi:hypothetical protein K493DRAFT_313486 [Basidiobolus meristosporus CBS 931.73]|uniref:Uncharacterized protein n=1 Tax=Basidiobolus meristosporus CBS 931.73 TaxID=1314790 RepID=A0A1Y1YL89_9FUNG|nr:hypothetical protein K493DRAFT_313486 [Basidiobolus meristosporus CBS 931.73]|eukprot:ORX98791.1 hypothetical protein K493DRAFT_313486 [Basidiobolus meristosporus CBS 931.73]